MNKAKKDVPKRIGRASFWARKESIEKMLEGKHTILAIFLAHQKEVNIGYGQFRRYVNELNELKRSKADGYTRGTEKGQGTKEKRPIRARDPGQPAFVSSDTPRDRGSLVGGKK